jgi:hypothetical protein
MPKQTIKISERTTVDHLTGEITKEEFEKVTRLPSEDNYIKIYLKTIGVLYNVPSGSTTLLTSLLSRVNYDNEIILNTTIRKRIAKEIGIQPNTLFKSMKKLVDQKLLIKVDTGIYKINTYVFGRGNWKDIQDHRNMLGFSCEFSEDKNGNAVIAFKSYVNK